MAQAVSPKLRQPLVEASGLSEEDWLRQWPTGIDSTQPRDANNPAQLLLRGAAARYLSRLNERGQPLDPVARFHLGNGARLEHVHWLADPSAKGQKQSYGLMVNYLYDLGRLDRHRAMLAEGKTALSREVMRLAQLG